jgi:hypothetical protein
MVPLHIVREVADVDAAVLLRGVLHVAHHVVLCLVAIVVVTRWSVVGGMAVGRRWGAVTGVTVGVTVAVTRR